MPKIIDMDAKIIWFAVTGIYGYPEVVGLREGESIHAGCSVIDACENKRQAEQIVHYLDSDIRREIRGR